MKDDTKKRARINSLVNSRSVYYSDIVMCFEAEGWLSKPRLYKDNMKPKPHLFDK